MKHSPLYRCRSSTHKTSRPRTINHSNNNNNNILESHIHRIELPFEMVVAFNDGEMLIANDERKWVTCASHCGHEWFYGSETVSRAANHRIISQPHSKRFENAIRGQTECRYLRRCLLKTDLYGKLRVYFWYLMFLPILVGSRLISILIMTAYRYARSLRQSNNTFVWSRRMSRSGVVVGRALWYAAAFVESRKG